MAAAIVSAAISHFVAATAATAAAEVAAAIAATAAAEVAAANATAAAHLLLVRGVLGDIGVVTLLLLPEDWLHCRIIYCCLLHCSAVLCTALYWAHPWIRKRGGLEISDR